MFLASRVNSLFLASRVNSLPQPVTQFFAKIYVRGLSACKCPHSLTKTDTFGQMRVRTLAALKDNYMFLIMDPCSNEAAVVDPAEPESVLKAVKEEKVDLTTVLTTHHHWDHSAGNETIVKKMPGLKVYGGDNRIRAMTSVVKHNDKFQIGTLKVVCLYTPCHTTGHFCFYVKHSEECNSGALFAGDTLFVGGCGRFFEGTAEQMCKVVELLNDLPDQTKVFSSHELAVPNLAFAKEVEPDNEYVLKKLEWAKKTRAKNMPTVPTTLGEEKLYNPFMRIAEESVQRYVDQDDPIETMKAIRQGRNDFKG